MNVKDVYQLKNKERVQTKNTGPKKLIMIVKEEGPGMVTRGLGEM